MTGATMVRGAAAPVPGGPDEGEAGSMPPATDHAREAASRPAFPRFGRLLRWEVVLLVMVAAAFGVNAWASPYFLDIWNLSDATFNFTEKAIIALPMALLILVREIDISVASIIALASVMMGLLAEAGYGTPVLVLAGLLTGLAAGAFNGLLVTGFRAPSIVATIGTMSLFRGIAYAVLGDGVLKAYPKDFAWFGQGYVWGPLTFEFALFLGLAVVFGIVLHATVIGRRLYAIGNNPVAAVFSGVAVDRYRFALFALVGLAAGLASVLLTSRLGSTRPSIAMGLELEVITMVVLGGVSILGGSGSILGVVLAALLMGLVTFGLGLINVPGVVMQIVVGFLLIAVVAAPVVIGRALGMKSSHR